MRLATIRIAAGLEGSDALTASLQAVCAAAGSEIPYDDIHVALGSAFLTCVNCDDSSPAQWIDSGRDLHLPPAARLFGLQVRDLHPIPAARGLAAAAEYQAHFVDSYYPLICRALRNDQPVLAWQGWPAPWALSWGVLTAETGTGLALMGVVPGGAEAVPLQSAAIQCYVVENATPARPDRLDVLRCGLEAVRRLGGSVGDAESASVSGSALGLAVGAAAYERWMGWVRGRGVFDEPAWAENRQFALAVRSSRRAGGRFLRSCAEGLDPRWRGRLDALIADCQAVDDALGAEDGELGMAGVVEAIVAAQAADRQLADGLLALADHLGRHRGGV